LFHTTTSFNFRTEIKPLIAASFYLSIVLNLYIRDTKLVISIKNFTYTDRLKMLKLPTL